jgi:hypothetical protein
MLNAVKSTTRTTDLLSSTHFDTRMTDSESFEEEATCAHLIRAVEERNPDILRNQYICDTSLADQAMQRAIELNFFEAQQVLLEKMPQHDFFDCLESAMKQAKQPHSFLVTQIMTRVSDETLRPQSARVKEFGDFSKNIYLNWLNCTAVEKGETQFLSRIVSLHKSDSNYGDNLPAIYKSIYEKNKKIPPEIQKILLKMDPVFFNALEMAVKINDEQKIRELLSDPTSREFSSRFIELVDFLWGVEDLLCLDAVIAYMHEHVKVIYGTRYIDMFLKVAAQEGNVGKITMVTNLLVGFAPQFIAGKWNSKTIKTCIDTGFSGAKTPEVKSALMTLKDKVQHLYPEVEASKSIPFINSGSCRFFIQS